MSISRNKRILLTGAAALGVAAGAAGIAGAATVGNASNDRPADAVEEHDGSSYTSSITVDDTNEAANEADEAAQLERVATVSADEARRAAGAAVTGTVGDAELENEDGNVVWSVEVTGNDGSVTEVIVDAGDAKVLAQSAEEEDDGESEDEAEEAGETEDEANEGPEGDEAGEQEATTNR